MCAAATIPSCWAATSVRRSTTQGSTIVLAGLALELAHDRVDGDGDAGDDGGGVGVDQPGQLLAVVAAERADLDRRHGANLLETCDSVGGRYRCGTRSSVSEPAETPLPRRRARSASDMSVQAKSPHEGSYPAR
jgi:hypothetical protein